MTIDGETRITGLIGDPVAHSRSPAILNTAYREAGLNWVYAAFPVPRGRGGDAVRGALALRFAGLTVTMPHKADAAGACGMVGGQAIDLEAAGAGASFDGEGLRAMHARKTGALIRASAAAGAVMAGATEAQLQAIERFASELGLAFQIVDDILDVEGASHSLGKTAGKDAAAGKPTYPALFGLEASRRMAADCVGRALGALEAGHLHGQLPAIATWVTSRSN